MLARGGDGFVAESDHVRQHEAQPHRVSLRSLFPPVPKFFICGCRNFLEQKGTKETKEESLFVAFVCFCGDCLPRAVGMENPSSMKSAKSVVQFFVCVWPPGAFFPFTMA